MARGLRIGSKTDVLKNLRSLLRVTRKRSSEPSVRECQWSQQVLAQYRARQHETDREKMRAYRSEATDLLILLDGVQEQKYLWELDAGAEQKLSAQEIVNRSAKRVGLFVPDTYVDAENKTTNAAAEKEAAAREAAAKYLAAKKAKEAAKDAPSS
ncbi:hypothetical protein Poli38472_001860 [Pythium oligandrum]|uniref:Uncharacterized protein n=1 Tax=Pythium oligandrum TaxID=41045 RepID=A0A8K1FQR6_PYTOL|nr:hypothetical protein Poli38472_001860 [Pythium oligandrum]|eukprot:TMW69704.1 hypothetical protein Poli38472_001860 [Pythium oligandrum]